MSDWKKLRELAEAATPGPWENRPGIDPPGDIIAPGLGEYGPKPFITHVGSWGRSADAAFIAAANPQTVLALLDEIERLRARLKTHEREFREHDANMRSQLAAALAAKDEACDIVERMYARTLWTDEESMIREVDALRKIGR